MNIYKNKLAVIGLGYVGLPLIVEFSKKYDVIGFDVNSTRVDELSKGYDRTNEVREDDLAKLKNINFSHEIESLKGRDIYIIAVPTPIDKNKNPDLKSLKQASIAVGKILNKDNIVIYESTVYPGCTEEVCVPILEKYSGLIMNKDFLCGYSPERVNPGDSGRKLPDIVKVTSGSNQKASLIVDNLYKTIIDAGTFRATSINVAEAAKVIENTQRDLNIALMNEFALIFRKLNINTRDVLEAASTKWNFMNFKPGLVGGHCIGVDPYYLTYKSKKVGYSPKVILSGRKINDGMGSNIAKIVKDEMSIRDIKIKNSRVLIMGFTFKENCPDIRNTRIIDLIEELEKFGINVSIYDPLASKKEVMDIYKIKISNNLNFKHKFSGLIFAVEHNAIKDLSDSEINNLILKNSFTFDIKNTFHRSKIDSNL